ncbi:flagellar type III secretion system protein FlhB [Pontibaca salina]|uniref:Flagellar biosynthesis protein FlhB n=1 Tax=Pontibaca salina TaxID=2795731 RepID=A0A934HTM7_9RHOB|nr:flagellar type III secretion system protein FlhB [Pontibaca salina]MBI6629394.1 flagellar biosynthesis protein FlhB [Pontibaca salina]
MSSASDEDSEKSHEATPQKLQKARKKGEIAKSTDVSVAAGYAGLLLTVMVFGAGSIERFGSAMMVMLDQPDQLATLFFDGGARAPAGGLMQAVAAPLAPWFVIPAAAVMVSILAQRAFVFAPSKITPKLARISILSNAKNKFGRSGFFQFSKSFAKLVLYSVCLGLFLQARLHDMVGAASSGSLAGIALMARLCIEFMFLVVVISTAIAGLDMAWQYHEHLRKNRMSRKEIMDEAKEAEGDPHMKQQRRQRGQEIAMKQMMAHVPGADVVIVNPTHYAVALKWSRMRGTAPVCVAKGRDEIASTIRETAMAAGVPIHSDPPTARAIHATVALGQEITEDHYRAVAAAIRFAERMRMRARAGLR